MAVSSVPSMLTWVSVMSVPIGAQSGRKPHKVAVQHVPNGYLDREHGPHGSAGWVDGRPDECVWVIDYEELP